MRFSRVPVVYLIYVLLCLAAYHHCRKMSSSESEKAGSSLPSSPLANSSLDGTPVKRARSYGRFFSKKVDLFGDGSHDGADISDVSANDENDIANILQPTVSHEEVLSSSSDTDTSSSESDSSDDESDSSDEESDSSCFSSGSDSSFSDSDSADSEESSEYDIAEVQELFSGSEKTTDEAIVALMDLYINRRWKLSTLREVLKFCHAFFPSNLPKSDYKLFSYVESHASENYQEICHYYCGDCLTLKKERNDHCDECDSTQTSVFFEFPLSVQIKHLFEQRNLAGLIDSYRSKIANDENICDITSGYAFRKLKTEVSGKYDLTLLFNSDGISPVNSSEAHLYPILATICEISPKLRSSHLIVCGIWYDLTFAPVMNDFFKPFVSELCKIEEEGITWTHPGTKQEFQSVVTAPVLSADALGRAEILVMQHHMGKHGCNSCEQKTKRFKPESGKKIRRYVYQEKPAKLRSKDRMDKQGRKAAEGLPVKGVVGNAVVSRIPHFNRGNSAPPEYMHCVLLGVVLQFLKLWFKTPGEWNIKGKMNDIDRFIVKSVKVTDQYGRVPKKN